MMHYIQVLITHPHHLLNLYVKNQQLPIQTFQLENGALIMKKMQLLSTQNSRETRHCEE